MAPACRALAALLLATACATVAAQRGSFYEDDPCKQRDGSDGVCKVFARCPSALREVRRLNFPRVCAFDGFTPIVCCEGAAPPAPATPAPPPTTTPNPATPRPTRPSISGAENSKARKMCERWGEEVYELQSAVVLTPGAPRRNVSRCAVPDLKGSVPYIVGGQATKRNEFPHMAAVGYMELKDDRWLCGGSLISERFVLTAAHCLEDAPPPKGVGKARWVRLGYHNLLESPKDGAITLAITDLIAHPDYDPNAKYNDVALLKLEKDVKFSAAVRPACLWTNPKFEGRPVATGWGRTFDGGPLSDELLKVQLPSFPQERCQAAYDPNVFTKYRTELRNGIVDSMVCAGGEKEGGRDTCQGDSGGPLQTLLSYPFCTYAVIGLTSFGKTCAAPDTPGVYSRVSSFVPWIESVVWP